MKRLYTFIMSLFCLMALNAQQNYKVSTTQEKRNVLLEEFTGVNCSFCPDGHRIAKELKNGYADRLTIVNMHAGPYSPKGNELDLTTDEGDSLAYHFDPTSYPCALINRHVFQNNDYLYGRDGWYFYINKLMEETAPLNLYVESKYDDNTKKLTIHVEGYSFEDNDNLKLYVLLTQDYINIRQVGVPNPQSYVHMKVLRDYISSYKGDVIGAKKKGEYFSADYTYDVPATVSGQELKPGNIDVVAYVTSKDLTEVLNVESIKPEYVNMSLSADAEFLAPNINVGDKYGFNFFEGKIRNKYNERITKATFGITINNEYQEVVADCNVSPFETDSVNIPCNYSFDENGKVKYEVKLLEVNGNSVTPTSLSGEFSKPLSTGKNVKVEIVTDRTAEENSYLLKDEDGVVLKVFGPYPNKSSKKYEENIILEEDKTYCIEVNDYFGNGVLSGKKGSLTTIDSNGNVIDEIVPIHDFGERSFFTVDKALAIENITITETNNGKTFSINGTLLNGDNTSERIIIRNGKKYLNK